MALIPPSQRAGGYTLPEGITSSDLSPADRAYISGSAGPVSYATGSPAGGQGSFLYDPVADINVMANKSATQALTLGETSLAGLGTTALAALSGLGISIPEPITTALGLFGIGYAGAQALGLGEGGGILGNNLLGGDTIYVGGIPLGGPGLAEPPASMIEKEWETVQGGTKCHFWLVRMPDSKRRRVYMYNFSTQRYKYWTIRKPSVAYIGKKMPSHKMIVRLRKNLSKQSADARTILKITSPTSLKNAGRRRRR